jgi:hypothetical protein
MKLFAIVLIVGSSSAQAMSLPPPKEHRCSAVYDGAMATYNQQVSAAQQNIQMEFTVAEQKLKQANLIQNSARLMCREEAMQNFERDLKLVPNDSPADVLNRLVLVRSLAIQTCEDNSISHNRADIAQYNSETAAAQETYRANTAAAKAQYDQTVATCH